MTAARAGLRITSTTRDVMAGCFVCHGSDAHWFGGAAQGTAARHHDSTGHATWCDVAMSVFYGRKATDPRQIDIEDSIASLGILPDAAPLTDLDAPAVAPAGVSVPVGRPVETRALAAATAGARP